MIMFNETLTTLDPEFDALLADFDRTAMQRHKGTIYGLWPDLTLAYMNSAWTSFSEDNGGESKIGSAWNLGRHILAAMSGPLRPFYAENYRRCLAEDRPWEHVYECPSATLYRQLHMTVFPLGQGEGFLVINSLRQESAHPGIASSPLRELYENEHGHLVQCSHCRRVRRAGEDQHWDWVPDWVATQPGNTSHGLCEPCVGFYYSDQRMDGSGFAIPFQANV